MKNKLFLIILLFILAGCDKDEIIFEKTLENKTLTIRTETPKIEVFTPSIECYGNLSFTKKTSITAASEGYVKNIYGKVGDKIYKGQPLLEIENVQLSIQKTQIERSIETAQTSLMLSEAQVEDAKRSVEAKFLSLEKSELQLNQKLKELELAESTLAKKEELFKVDGISGDEIESLRLQTESLKTSIEAMRVDYKISQIGFRDKDIESHFGYIPTDPVTKIDFLIELNIRKELAEVKVAEAQLASKEAELESLQILIDELTVKSPYDGILGARQIEEGERVKSGDDLLTTFIDNEIHAVFNIQENQIHLINIGQLVEVTIPSLEDNKYNFKVSQISPTIDQNSGNITVKAISDNKSKDFIPGMFFKGEISLSSPETRTTISESSIIYTSENKGNVFLVKNNRIFLRGIEFSSYKDGKAVIENGLKKGDVIALSPTSNYKDGMEVYFFEN